MKKIEKKLKNKNLNIPEFLSKKNEMKNWKINLKKRNEIEKIKKKIQYNFKHPELRPKLILIPKFASEKKLNEKLKNKSKKTT